MRDKIKKMLLSILIFIGFIKYFYATKKNKIKLNFLEQKRNKRRTAEKCAD